MKILDNIYIILSIYKNKPIINCGNKIKKDYQANLGEIFKYIKDLTFKLE